MSEEVKQKVDDIVCSIIMGRSWGETSLSEKEAYVSKLLNIIDQAITLTEERVRKELVDEFNQLLAGFEHQLAVKETEIRQYQDEHETKTYALGYLFGERNMVGTNLMQLRGVIFKVSPTTESEVQNG